MRQQFYTIFILLLIILSVGVKAQNGVKPFITVEGEVLRPLKLTIDDLSRLKQAEAKAKDKDGKEHVFKGVLLANVLDSAGVTLGAKMRGENLAKYVLVKAADGYKVIFSLGEVDPGMTNQTVLLADQSDGKPLPKGEGPFRMVVPGDKKHARWIREITSITIVMSKD